MNAKHTPGPWEAVGRDVLSMHIYPRASGPLVCVVDDNDNSRWPADAELIASAPDLLAALEKALDESGCDGDLCMHYWHDAARAAIAKAKGGAA